MNVQNDRLINRIVINWKSSTFPFKDTSLEWKAPNLLNMLPKQNWAGTLKVLVSDLNPSRLYYNWY